MLAAFAGFAAVAAKPFATFLRENVTFTRKEFVSYSERRRLGTTLALPRQPEYSVVCVFDDCVLSKEHFILCIIKCTPYLYTVRLAGSR